MKKRSWWAIVAFALALAPASVAQAGSEDHEGWYLEVEGASLTPGNLNTPLVLGTPAASAIGGSSGTFENDIRYSVLDNDVAYRIGFGYAWGKKGQLQVTYWSYSADDTNTGFADAYSGSGTNYNWFGIGPASSFYYSFYYPVGFSFEHEIDATTVDVEYKRPASFGDNLRLMWGVGFRYAKFEEDVRGLYVVDPLGGASSFLASRTVEGDGIGFTGSIGVEYMFKENLLGISTNLRVGFLTSDVDSESSIIDLDGYYLAAGGTIRESTEINDEVAMTTDFDVNLIFHASDKVEFDVGWMFSRWSDLPTANLGRTAYDVPAFTDQRTDLLGEDRDHLSWSGPRVRARFMF